MQENNSWWRDSDLNRGRTALQAVALPTELSRQEPLYFRVYRVYLQFRGLMTDKLASKEVPENKEIERKFVIAALPADLHLDDLKGKKINQGYLEITDEAASRVRQKGDRYFYTYKSAPGEHAAEREEKEHEITREEFDLRWPETEGKRVEKTRYEIPLGDFTIELDIFEGQNAGHILAEVEFPSTDAADSFEPPAWFGPDVTADKRFGNSQIALHGFPEI